MSASRQPREGRHGGGPSLSRFKPSTPPQPPPLSASPIIYDPRGKDGSLVVDGTQLSNISVSLLCPNSVIYYVFMHVKETAHSTCLTCSY